MGKRRTATSKAPQTPVRRPTKRTDVKNDIAVTPTQELAIMGLSKEDLFMCSQSQTMNSQIDVKWDCNSPDALRQIRLTRGKRLHSDTIDDLVMKLANELPVEDCHNTPPLLGLWMSSKEEPDHTKYTNSVNQKPRRSERRRRTRRPSCEKSSVNAKKLVQQLELALHKDRECDKAQAATCQDEQKPVCKSSKSPEAVPCEVIPPTNPSRSECDDVGRSELHLPDLSRDLFESMDTRINQKETCSDKKEGVDPSLTSNCTISSKGAMVCAWESKKVLACSSPARLETVSEENEAWSDDDLFADDSLILKVATVEFAQPLNPTPPRTRRLSKRKSLLTSPSEPKVKTKRYTFSLNDSINPIQNSTGPAVPLVANGARLKQDRTEPSASKPARLDSKAPLVPSYTNRIGTGTKLGGKLSTHHSNSNIVNNLQRSRTRPVTWGMRQEANKYILDQLRPNVNSSSSVQISVPSGSRIKTVCEAKTVPSNSTSFQSKCSPVNSSTGFCEGFGQLSSSQSYRNVAPSPSRSFKRHNTFPCPFKEKTGVNYGSSYSSYIPSTQNKPPQPPVLQNDLVRNKLSTVSKPPQISNKSVNQSANKHGVSSSVVAPSQANTASCKKSPTVLKASGSMDAPRTTHQRGSVPGSQNNASHQPVQHNSSGHPQINSNNMSEVVPLSMPKFVAPRPTNPSFCKKSPQIVSSPMNGPKTAGPGVGAHPKTGTRISPGGHKYRFSTTANDFPPCSPAGRTRSSRRPSLGMNSFNTSLTDDLLCQLAEPDDLLESQADFCPPDLSQVDCQQEVSDHLNSGILAEEIAKLDETLHKLKSVSPNNHRKPATSKTVFSFSNAPKLSDFQKPVRKHKQEHEKPKCSLASSVGAKTNFPNESDKKWLAQQKSTNRNLNSSQFVRPSQSGKYHFKPVRHNSGTSSGSSSSRSKPSTSSTSSNPGASSSKETVHSKGKSEMDDSFMNEDDDFSTPQILAMLDEVETQASQTSAVFKCTPDEIEKKKRAALERRLKNQQQHKKRPIVRPSTRQYKPLF